MSQFRDNAAASRFELDTPDGISFADYRDVGPVRLITHVETPAAARGKGYAAQLMDAIVAHVRARDSRVRASCSYAVAYFERTPNARDVLA